MKSIDLKRPRCPWTGSDPIYIAYHDDEWGYPVHDDIKLFENLVLDGFQAGLSWLTILKKRDNFRTAFSQWNPEKIARYSDTDIERLMQNKGIIRNRMKIKAAIKNAQAFLNIQEEKGSFSEYIWQFTDGKTLITEPRPITLNDIPVRSDESEKMSRDLKQNGFGFVGPTICYAFMQACGLVDDHVRGCFRVD